MRTTNIHQYYSQARHWENAKLDRHLLARSTGDDTALVVALTLAKISRTINSKDKQPRQNVLEDPEDLLKYLVQESLRCSDSDKATTIQILFSIAERCIDECEQVQTKSAQAVLRACARIGVTFPDQSFDRVEALCNLEKIAQTSLTWRDVAAFAAGDSLKLGGAFRSRTETFMQNQMPGNGWICCHTARSRRYFRYSQNQSKVRQ